MRPAERGAQAPGLARHQDQVDMVRHQAISPDRDPGRARMFAQEIELDAGVRVLEEDLLAPVAPQGNLNPHDVLRQARHLHTRQSRHAKRLGSRYWSVN